MGNLERRIERLEASTGGGQVITVPMQYGEPEEDAIRRAGV